jgi:hypothetical protein
MSNKPEKAKGGSLRTLDAVLVVGGGIIGIVIAFAVLHFVVGIFWELVKIAVIVAFVGAIFWMLGRRRR